MIGILAGSLTKSDYSWLGIALSFFGGVYVWLYEWFYNHTLKCQILINDNNNKIIDNYEEQIKSYDREIEIYEEMLYLGLRMPNRKDEKTQKIKERIAQKIADGIYPELGPAIIKDIPLKIYDPSLN